MRDFLGEILRDMGGDYAKAAISITDKKYKEYKTKTNKTLYKMKDGKYKILDYHKNCYGTFYDIDMAKKNFVELYEKEHKDK